MNDKSGFLDPSVYDYLAKVSLREHSALKSLRDATDKLTDHIMRISADQAQFMQFLLKTINAKRVLEIGMFTGYSALAMALALPVDGYILTCDVDARHVTLAEQFLLLAGVREKVEIRIAPALETMNKLLENNQQNSFDFIFIDADKQNYQAYYELALQLVKHGGIIALDNVLWLGRLVQEDDGTASTQHMRELNEKILNDERVDITMLPIGGGLTLARKI